MNIKFSGKNLLFKNSSISMLIKRDVKAISSDEYDVVVALDQTEASNKVISNPGEYEINDILVYAVDTTNNLQPDSIVFDFEGIKVIYLSAEKDLNVEKILENVSICDIVIAEINEENFLKQIDNINEIEPNMVIPLVDNDVLLEKTKKEFGGMPEAKTTIKVSSSDFTQEDRPTILEILK
ncbi:MAG: hypothetical protein WCJ58_02270 [bacterium]